MVVEAILFGCGHAALGTRGWGMRGWRDDCKVQMADCIYSHLYFVICIFHFTVYPLSTRRFSLLSSLEIPAPP